MKGSDSLARYHLADRDLQCPVWGAVMARRSVYEQMVFFDGRYSFWSDIDMWFRIAERYDFVAHPCRRLSSTYPNRKAMPHLFDKHNLGSTPFYVSDLLGCKEARRYRHEPLTQAIQLSKQVSGYGDVARRQSFKAGLGSPAGVAALPLRFSPPDLLLEQVRRATLR